MGNLPLSCWLGAIQKTPQTMAVIAFAVGFLLDLEGKTLLVKTHTHLGHRASKNQAETDLEASILRMTNSHSIGRCSASY